MTYDPMSSMNAFAAGANIGSGIRKQETQAKLAPMMANGQYGEAMQYAGQRGDTDALAGIQDAIAKMSEQEKAAAAERTEGIARIAIGGLEVPEPQLGGYVQQNAQQLMQYGITPDQIAQWSQGGLTRQALEGFVREVTPISELLKKPTYFAPTEITGADGKPTLAQFSNEGGAPQTFDGVAPYVKPEPEKPFTLSPGQVRYNPDGSVAVEGPAKTQSNGITIGPDGTVQIGGPAGFGSSNKGKDPALVRTEDGTPAVSPGEQQARMNKVTATNKTLEVSDAVVAQDIDRAVDLAGAWTTGFVGAKLEGLEGTPAHDLKMVLQSIKANIGFDKLQQMRDNSPTGGALGQVTELELGLLQSVYGALEQSQTKEQFVYNLKRLKDIKTQFATLRAEAFAMDYPDIQTTKDFREEATLESQGELPPDKMQRLQELRRKRDAGQLQ